VRTLWQRSGDTLVRTNDGSPRPTVGETDVVVRVQAQVLAPSDSDGHRLGAVGVVEKAGSEALELMGDTVVVPAVIPASEERDAPLVPLSQQGFAGACIASHISCPARWALPMRDGLELPLPLGALVARELADAYAVFLDSRPYAGASAVVIGNGPRAELCRQLALARDCHVAAASVAAEVADIEAQRGERARERAHVMIATSDDSLLEAAASWLQTLDRPSVAIWCEQSQGSLNIGALCARGARVSGVAGCHPDLLIDLFGAMAKGELDLTRAAKAVSVDAPIGNATVVVTLPDA